MSSLEHKKQKPPGERWKRLHQRVKFLIYGCIFFLPVWHCVQIRVHNFHKNRDGGYSAGCAPIHDLVTVWACVTFFPALHCPLSFLDADCNLSLT